MDKVIINLIKEEVKKQKTIKENWEGVDRDLETSLKEYGFVAEQKSEDEWFILYKLNDNNYSTGYIKESELDEIVKGNDWANEKDIQGFLETTGSSLEEWLGLSFISKLSDLSNYWGFENLLGSSYSSFSEKEAEELIMKEFNETKKIKLSELRKIVKNLIKENKKKLTESSYKLNFKDFSKWLGYDAEKVKQAIEIVKLSDPDAAHTHLEDMGKLDLAEIVEAIYFEYGSLKEAISACKEDMEV